MLHKKCPHCSCLQPNGTFADLFRKLDFLKNEPQAKEKKAKTENESQSVSKKRKQSDKKDHQFLPVYGKEIIKTNKKRCSY